MRPSMQKHQLQVYPSDQPFVEDGPRPRNMPQGRVGMQRMPGTSVAMQQAPSAWGMLRISVRAHRRECQARGSQGAIEWALWMLLMLPIRCTIEVLSLLNIVPGEMHHCITYHAHACTINATFGCVT